MKARICTTIILVLMMATGSAQAQPTTWPQSFTLLGVANPAHYTFAVASPGKIVVTVQWTGSPLTIVLTRPDGQKISSNVKDSPRKKGSPNVKDSPREKESPSVSSATMSAVAYGASNWQLDISPTPVPVPQTPKGQIPRPDPNLVLNAKGTVSVQYPQQLSAEEMKKLVPLTDYKKLPAGGISRVPAPAPTPMIGSLSKNPVQPGDEVIIRGSGFGSTPDAVKLVLANGREVFEYIYPPNWSDTSIKFVVPQHGIMGYDLSYYGIAKVDVKEQGNVLSNPGDFRVDPIIVTHKLSMFDIFGHGDNLLKPASPPLLSGPTISPGNTFISRSWGIVGEKGEDEFFIRKRLVNNWKVVRAFLDGGQSTGKAGATIIESFPGTDVPHVKVHFFGDAYSSLRYSLAIEITGPQAVDCFQGENHPCWW